MRGFVIYDSNFGNTRLVAENIAKQLGRGVTAVSVKEMRGLRMADTDLLIVGSPINAWNPTSATRRFLRTLGKHELSGVKAAAFDTRLKSFISGDAAKKISKALEKAGARIVAEPIGFYIDAKGKEQHLHAGELNRSAEWARGIKAKVAS